MLPIDNYDTLSVDEITVRLPDLTDEQLRVVRAWGTSGAAGGPCGHRPPAGYGLDGAHDPLHRQGGVGKTTLAAATALRSASLGHRALIISTDIAHSLADALDTPLGNEPRPVNGLLEAAELDTGEELERYWGDVKRRIASLLRQEGIDAIAAGELAVLPGLDEVLALVRIMRYHDEGRYDTLVIDSAPTGAAMRLLSAPDLSRWYTGRMLGLSRGLARIALPSIRSLVKAPIGEDAIRERITALFDQVERLRQLLSDHAATSVRLVMNPDHLSLQETQRAYTYMNLFGLAVDALFVNRVLPMMSRTHSLRPGRPRRLSIASWRTSCSRRCPCLRCRSCAVRWWVWKRSTRSPRRSMDRAIPPLPGGGATPALLRRG